LTLSYNSVIMPGMTQAIWTLDELTERVGQALSVGYHGQPSGRVRHLPDQRAIRWYTTIGLVDRPAATRGRTAMYGPRHLLQLVAIKRLQAQGLPLVAIQAELAGATDAQLARVAQLPEAAGVAEAAPPAAPAPSLRRPTAALRATPAIARPLSQAGASATAPAAGEAATPAATAGPGEGGTPADLPGAMAGPGGDPTLAAGPGQARQARFWRERPAAAGSGAAAGPNTAEADGVTAGPSAAAEAAGATQAAGAVAGPSQGPGVDGVATLQGVRLGERATLLLDPARPLDDADLRAILDAARPLLRALRARGLDHPGRELP
jgi:DNA-binding transcriptional MerR regulator